MNNKLKLAVSIIACEVVGIVGSYFTINSIRAWYVYLNKPALSPPNWIFGPVWTTLYFMMGISAYLIWKRKSNRNKIKNALLLFLIQLMLNFLWSLIFFGLRMPLLALLDIVLLWIMIVWTAVRFYKISKPAAYLLLPYLVWVSFASYLNFAIWLLNK